MNLTHTLVKAAAVVLLATIHPNDMNAQVNDLRWNHDREWDYTEKLPLRLDTLLLRRGAKLMKLGSNGVFADDVDYWWNGTQGFVRGYDPDSKDEKNARVIVPMKGHDVQPTYRFQRSRTRRGTTVSVKEHPGWKVSIEEVGPWQMLVVRNAQGQAVDCYVKSDFNDIVNRRNIQDYDMHDIYDGLYATSDGLIAVFGPKSDHYKDHLKHYESDPGCFLTGTDREDGRVTPYIFFGNGRVSRGNPASPKYGKMPGGGGAGARMGPMVWMVQPADGGLNIQITVDQEFVEHRPEFPSKQFHVKKVLSNCPQLTGLYPIASLRPLPRGLLNRFTPATLKVMKQEMKDRHTDGTPLTDIETLNTQLINAIIHE